MAAGKPQIQATLPRKHQGQPSDPPPSLGKFLRKALVVVVIIIVVPLFPSRAPEFINQSLFNRGWELLHLLFVGIAVCYGLFSRRNDQEEPHKETLDGSFETSVSRLLQASSSVFDDHLETLDGSGENSSRTSSVQSWSSQYSRNDPVVLVAAAAAAAANGDGENRGMVNRSMRTRVLGLDDKPLLLPVRSLKSTRVFDSGQLDGNPLFQRSNSNSIRASSDGQGDGNNVVLRSPIPWRSRSGRMEMEEQAHGFDVSGAYNTFKPVVLRSDQQRVTKSDSPCSTPRSLSPSPSIDLSSNTHLVSPELLAKEVGDGLERKTFYNPSQPPAPPLPPPKYCKPESPAKHSSSGGDQMAPEKEFTRVTSGEDSIRSVRRLNSRNSCSTSDNALIVGKKSVRTARTGESLKEAGTEGYWKDVMEAPKEPTRSERKFPVRNQPSMSNDKSDQAMNILEVPPLHKQEKVTVPQDIVTVESDSESEREDEDQVSHTLSSFRKGGETQPVNQAMSDFGPDVDKKADEFIAKFREQIRLQRIESIKRSAYQATRKVT